ncbi:hypothetical protein VP01_25g4 [Puccinia sorghi]|uniref:Putative 5'-nucleotidase C-terminal domain-containing protein n=1 Tax=Puccinia sorghi TaxID=27349 RepID=A0A0L6V594_9BASI|nr:hypothetical protein VP01_25g4 [Puccinia sorghi]
MGKPSAHPSRAAKTIFIPVISLLWSACLVLACNGGLHKRSQPSATQPRGVPARQLEWGDLNILHTTDTHVLIANPPKPCILPVFQGWLLGHLKSEQPEPNYSGDLVRHLPFTSSLIADTNKKAHPLHVLISLLWLFCTLDPDIIISITYHQKGDFHSFVLRMKKRASQKGVDLLVVDSGDLHDGNGLSDAEPFVHPGTPRGTTSSKIFTRVPYDILAIGNDSHFFSLQIHLPGFPLIAPFFFDIVGNHELYDIEIAQNMHDNFAPYWKGSYLSSNVNITTSGTSVPIGSRYRKFKTEHGRKVTAFGIIFHFTGNANGTIVQPPAKMALEPWFKEAIRDKPDVFLLAGHMGVHDSDWKVVLDSIRAIHPEVPVVILGGHVSLPEPICCLYHVRDCKQWDDRSMSMASGRYMETVGWMSKLTHSCSCLSGLKDPGGKLKFSRRYLDSNRVTYGFHAGDDFDTVEGVQTTQELNRAAQEFRIHHRLGVAPHSFYGYRVPSTSEQSLSYLFTGPDGVLETVIKNPKRRNPMLGIIHTTAMRADLYAGNFTSNDQFIVMPFNNSFQYVPDVPRVTAENVMEILNAGGPVRSVPQLKQRGQDVGTTPRGLDFHLGHDVSAHYLDWIRLQSEEHDHHHQTVLAGEAETDLPTYGYVTQDMCPGYGDDVLHTPLPVVDQSEYVATTITNHSADSIDVVFDRVFTSFFSIFVKLLNNNRPSTPPVPVRYQVIGARTTRWRMFENTAR